MRSNLPAGNSHRSEGEQAILANGVSPPAYPATIPASQTDCLHPTCEGNLEKRLDDKGEAATHPATVKEYSKGLGDHTSSSIDPSSLKDKAEDDLPPNPSYYIDEENHGTYQRPPPNPIYDDIPVAQSTAPILSIIRKGGIHLSYTHLAFLLGAFLFILTAVGLYTFAALARADVRVEVVLNQGAALIAGGRGGEIGGEVRTATITVVRTQSGKITGGGGVEGSQLSSSLPYGTMARGASSTIVSSDALISSSLIELSLSTKGSASALSPSSSTSSMTTTVTLPASSASTRSPAPPLTMTLITSVLLAHASVSPLTRHFTGPDAIGRVLGEGI